MIARLIRLAAMAALLGLVLGALGAGGLGGVDSDDENAWSAPATPNADENTREALLAQLIDTGHFGVIVEEAPTEDDADAPAPSGPPAIIAAATLDGDIRVSGLTPEGRVTSARVGESLGDGWIVDEADLKSVTLRREDARIKIEVFPRTDPES